VTRVHAAEAVSEQMFVQIGSIPQWITIKGKDRNNSVVLILRGGPGDALSPYADSCTRDGTNPSRWCNGTSVALAEPSRRMAPRSSGR
jgi:hypothetical protein